MFIGHFAVAYAAKKAAPKVSLGILFISAQLVDLLWPLFLLLGIEHVRIAPGITSFTPLDFYDYPYTHSLVGALFWTMLAGVLYYSVRRDKKSAIVIGAAVFSHWLLDLVTHRPDLPLITEGGTVVGLGLWNSIPATIIIELALFCIGVWIYLRSTNAKDGVGKYGVWGLVILLVFVYLANAFGPPPPSAKLIAIAGNATWLFVLLGYWTDKHRTPVSILDAIES
ncbi:MAG: hypothetical protein NTV54_14315 [Ignavibacteriales bacterium]|nr:hypothetical protein [Ignavibacteriales bacterium]